MFASDFREESELSRTIRSSVQEIAADYDDEYWREIHANREFPAEFWDDLAENDWLGVTVPEEYGGSGLGMKEVVILHEETGLAGGWSLGPNLLFTPVFGGLTLTRHGTEAQKEEWLPRIARGEAQFAIAVTEPDAGINTTSITTSAERTDDGYTINGRKMWISNLDRADLMTLLVRTTPKEEVDRPSQGLSVVLVDPETAGVEYDEIELAGWFPDHTYNLYLDDVEVSDADLVGTEGEGLHQFFDTLNAERIGVAATMYTIGLYAIEQASDYASERRVFGETPIGEYQGVQHPLAEAYADLQTSRLLTHRAAWMFDNEKEGVGTVSNIANYEAGKAAWDAIDAAMATHGGMSIAEETGLPWMQDMVRHDRVAPIPEEMILNHVAENELDLPRSY